MTRRLAWLAAAAMAPLLAQTPAPPVQVTVEGVPSTVWVQQPFEVVVRIAYDAAWFASSSVPLFQQAVDLPCHVVVPWLQAAEDRAVELVPPPVGGATVRVAVGDRIEALPRGTPQERDGRRYDELLLRCRWLPLARGALAVAPVQVRYAFATRFEEDFLRGRQPVDRQETVAQSAPQQFEVRNLPDGAPTAFTGAVGEFALAATLGGASVRVGEDFEVVLEVTGQGNLERFAAPRSFALEGFHVQGLVERRTPGRRRFALDVVALRPGPTAVPPLSFAAFSPAAAKYVTLTTAPLPLRVEPAVGELSPRLQELAAADARALARRNAWPAWVWAVIALALLGGGLTLQRWRQRRRRWAGALALRARLARGDLDAAAALQVFDAVLAFVVGGAEAGVADAGSQLAKSRLAPGVIARVRSVRAELDAARFGGAPPPTPELLAVVDLLVRG